MFLEPVAVLVASSPDNSTAQPAVAPSRGWVGVGGRNAFGLSGSTQPDFGGDAFGGLWLLHDHLQPILIAGWSRGEDTGVIVDAFRFGGELGLGTTFVSGHIWLGATLGLAGESLWGHRGALSESSGVVVLTSSGLVQARVLGRLLVGIECGPEGYVPLTHFVTPSGASPWTALRLNAGLRLGVILGDAMPR